MLLNVLVDTFWFGQRSTVFETRELERGLRSSCLARVSTAMLAASTAPEVNTLNNNDTISSVIDTVHHQQMRTHHKKLFGRNASSCSYRAEKRQSGSLQDSLVLDPDSQ
eukprot:gb/GECG01002861.1/.p1 GENE.gb/GECG01002861.1/~~gb/GECG01002861.1/.p1  ORF type:complete len:109 (+),score=12.13 gb/GECG01002861.1/:1-327(+)